MQHTILFPGRTNQIPKDVDISMSNVFFRVTTILVMYISFLCMSSSYACQLDDLSSS